MASIKINKKTFDASKEDNGFKAISDLHKAKQDLEVALMNIGEVKDINDLKQKLSQIKPAEKYFTGPPYVSNGKVIVYNKAGGEVAIGKVID